jgi:hypothetical protein
MLAELADSVSTRRCVSSVTGLHRVGSDKEQPQFTDILKDASTGCACKLLLAQIRLLGLASSYTLFMPCILVDKM